MYDIITLGSATVDVYANTDAEIIDIRTKNSFQELLAYPMGSKILINKLDFFIGGGGTNTAVSFSRLGLKTAYLGKIGKDETGTRITNLLKKEKIPYLGTYGKLSGFSVILDSFVEDRTILTFKGASNELTWNEVNKNKLRTKWIYSSSLQEKSYQTLKKVVAFAKKKKIKIAFNPSSYQCKEKKIITDILRHLEVLVLNKEEASLLVGNDSVKELTKKLHIFGPKIICVTDGSKGAGCLYKNTFYFIKPKPKRKIVETTGAGDAFASGLVSGLVYNKPIEFCLKLAIQNAESVVTHHGAKNKLLSKREAWKRIKADKRKISKEKI
tara:strand:- start:233 stop:1210 length:978 start_codon:yes stop_codon:yes gene_type:complete